MQKDRLTGTTISGIELFQTDRLIMTNQTLAAVDRARAAVESLSPYGITPREQVLTDAIIALSEAVWILGVRQETKLK
jgi:hypothetical protein